jgi:dihydrofolate synthase/folylpolyglutamate synthase
VNAEGDGGAIGSFEEAVEFLEQGLNYEWTQRWAYNKRWLNLPRMRLMLEAIGDPHLAYDVIHVAGTKGKGSTAGAIAHCLQRCGHRAGLLTSPHLVSPRERIRVNGEMIGRDEFTRIVEKIRPHVERKRREEMNGSMRAPTYFEMLTALGFEHFAASEADWAVVEVGLGGRLDSTNVVEPRCCVITAIGFDHMDKLGDTPEAIAAEKAGILKLGVPVVLGHQQYAGALETLRRMADERNCPRWEVGREVTVADAEPLAAPAERPEADVGWRFSVRAPEREYTDLSTSVLGAHQLDNLAAAVGALEMAAAHSALELAPERVAEAIADFSMPGRIEVLQRTPVLVLDAAHTVESVRALLEALDIHFPDRPVRAVFGCSAGKDLDGMLQLLGSRCVSITATQASLPRALPVEDVAGAAAETGIETAVVRDPWEAVQGALADAQAQEVVCVTGSFYVAGEVRAGWLAQHLGAAD